MTPSSPAIVRFLLLVVASASGTALAWLPPGAPLDAATPPAVRTNGTLRFTDVTKAAGITFRHNSGAAGQKLMPETMGSGVAFVDVDGDGWQDLLFVQSTSWPGAATRKPDTLTLMRNAGNGTFTDITKSAGLAVEIYGLGVAAADYDNDGHVDLYLTALGRNRLFRNLGGGRFQDVTAKAGVGDPGFSSSALWFDYDRDGRLDLFVANYVEWTIESDKFCSLDGKNKSYCTPELYKGQSPTLYRNLGNGTFADVTRKAGLYDAANKMLGVALLDYNGDGLLDVFGANDTVPNRLYHNNGNGTFKDVAVEAGVAFNEAGVARAGMGVDAADYDGSGRPSVVIGNFASEMMALYTNEGQGLFVDLAPRSTIGRASMHRLTFACFFFDADLDGLPDIFAANGHVADDIAKVQPSLGHAMPPLLFRNLGGRKFEDVTGSLGRDFAVPVVGRGAAHGDVDLDGDPDLAIMSNNGPARLLRNELTGGRSIRVTLAGTHSNRSAIGARVRVQRENGASPWQMVKTGSSYLSQSELPLTFGLGAAGQVKGIEVSWPTGKIEQFPGTKPGTAVTIVEGKGVTSAVPLR